MVVKGKDGEGIVRESGMDMDTLLCLTWRTSKELLDSTGNSAPCHVAAWMGGEFAGEGILAYGRLNPPVAGSRSSAPGKGPEEGGWAYAKAGLSLRSPPGNS